MSRATKSAVSPDALRRTLRLSVADATLYAIMVGLGEAYFLADAVRLGASHLVLGLVVALPLSLGGLGPVLALKLLARWHARRPFVVAVAAGQALTLLALSTLDGLRLQTPASLLGLAVLYQVFGQASGTVWSSWFGDLVPRAIRGSYFSRRNRAAYLGTCVGLVAGGLLLERLEATAPTEVGGGLGFAISYLCASLLRMGSVVLLASSVEPHFHGLANRVRVVRFLRSERGTRAWRLVGLFAMLQGAVYVAAPWFQPFMLEDLRFSYLEFMVASLAGVLFKVVLLPAWGRRIDASGPRPVAVVSAVLVALLPIPWLWARDLGWVLFAQALSGLSWAGLEVSQFALLLESSYRRTRMHVFAALSVLHGAAQLAGTLAGAALVSASGTLLSAFAASAVLRLVAAGLLPRLLPAAAGVPHVRARDLLLRVIGVRATGVVVHRPVASMVEVGQASGDELGPAGEELGPAADEAGTVAGADALTRP